MGFEPVGAEDDVVCTDGGDVEFGAFLVKIVFVVLDADGLDGGGAYGACAVHGAVDVFYRQGRAKGAESELVLLCKVEVDDHSFCAAIEEGACTDFSLRFQTDKEDSKCHGG